MFNLPCPHCGASVNIFSRQWQQQRRSNQKLCPHCAQAVEPVLSAKRYIPALLLLVAASLLAVKLFGLPASYLGTAVPFAFGVALFPAMVLKKQS